MEAYIQVYLCNGSIDERGIPLEWKPGRYRYAYGMDAWTVEVYLCNGSMDDRGIPGMGGLEAWTIQVYLCNGGMEDRGKPLEWKHVGNVYPDQH